MEGLGWPLKAEEPFPVSPFGIEIWFGFFKNFGEILKSFSKAREEMYATTFGQSNLLFAEY